MAQQVLYTVVSNTRIARDVYEMRLAGPTGMLCAPGQFINIKIEGFYLRRPISVCDWDDKGLTLVYKVLGKGTAVLAEMPAGQTLDTLAGLGNGFSLRELPQGARTVLAGGGVGVPPLYGLAKALCAQGFVPLVALGFAGAEDVFYTEKFAGIGCEVRVATVDGSAGIKGFVTQLLQAAEYDTYYACGPQAMLQAVHRLGEEKGAVGQLSFEERMGCGFGTCMGCTCQTKNGAKRVCAEGPVFTSGEVIFA